MRIATRSVIVAAALAAAAAIAAACGGSSGPTAPGSESARATIAGTVHGGSALLLASPAPGQTAAGVPAGMTVTVAGTNLSAAVSESGQFHIEGVQAGSIELVFSSPAGRASVRITVGQAELIQIQVTVNGSSAAIVNEVRTTGKVSLCHSTGNGSYHPIEVSVSAEPAHRAHGDAKVGEPVPADPTKVFDQSCRPTGASVRIEKSTNGQDADQAPGPTVTVGSAVSWQYVVTNTGTVPLTGVTVSDDRGVAVSCPQTSLAAGQSMTCTGAGTATAGQYRNVGTARATWTGGTVTDTDPSHYFGQAPNQDAEGPKVQLCHRTGNGSYHLIEVSVSAEPAHRAHGDGKIGEAVPGNPGRVFQAGCAVR
jgi:hypothetical protein